MKNEKNRINFFFFTIVMEKFCLLLDLRHNFDLGQIFLPLLWC